MGHGLHGCGTLGQRRRFAVALPPARVVLVASDSDQGIDAGRLTGERAMFRSLIKVNGVGAKMALAILSGINAEGFARCVEQEDSAAPKAAAPPERRVRRSSIGHVSGRDRSMVTEEG